MASEEQFAKRRVLLDAIYAMCVGCIQIRIDEQLLKSLERAWDAYDAALRAQALAEVEAQRCCWVCEGTGQVWSTTPGLPPSDCSWCGATGVSQDIIRAVEAVREAGPR